MNKDEVKALEDGASQIRGKAGYVDKPVKLDVQQVQQQTPTKKAPYVSTGSTANAGPLPPAAPVGDLARQAGEDREASAERDQTDDDGGDAPAARTRSGVSADRKLGDDKTKAAAKPNDGEARELKALHDKAVAEASKSDCPAARRHASQIQRINRSYYDKQVRYDRRLETCYAKNKRQATKRSNAQSEEDFAAEPAPEKK